MQFPKSHNRKAKGLSYGIPQGLVRDASHIQAQSELLGVAARHGRRLLHPPKSRTAQQKGNEPRPPTNLHPQHPKIHRPPNQRDHLPKTPIHLREPRQTQTRNHVRG